MWYNARMTTPKVTPKDFFLWFGAMLALYVSVMTYITLLFTYLDVAFPDPLSYYSDPYASGASYAMATLVVLVPLFLVLMHFIRSSIASDSTRADVWVRRWALHLTLFVSAIAVVVDLIVLLMYFFDGDVSLRFVLKVLVVLLVCAAGFLHFLADLRGFWKTHAGQARMVGGAVAILVLASIVAGFFIIGTPWQAREYRADAQRVSDLQQLQGQLISYWQSKDTLPASLQALNDPYSGFAVPHDPLTGSDYEYAATTTLAFELCATFNAPTRSNAALNQYVSMPTPAGVMSDTAAKPNYWMHGVGRTCFYRTIDPELYAPTTATKLR